VIEQGLAGYMILILLRGDLGIDVLRRQSHRRLAAQASSMGKAAPPALLKDVDALDSRVYVFVPLGSEATTKGSQGGVGTVIRTSAQDRPFGRLTRRANWEMVMGNGRDCLKPQFWSGPQ
jgi:hypothetical protein